jgi:hypothetical protein
VNPIPEITISPIRLAVYRLLVDGRGPGSGNIIPEIAITLKKSTTCIENHVRFLESESYVSKILGTKRPAFYKRGIKSNLLDSLTLNIEANPKTNLDSGTVKANPILTEQTNPLLTANIPTARTHIDGRVVFEVLQIGDMHKMNVPDGSGGKREYILFPKEPARDHHNTTSFRCRVPFDGYQVAIELWQSSERSQLNVWPPQVDLVPEQFAQAEQIFTTRAQQVVNLLSKYAGWRFGLVNFKGDIHFASTDDRLLSQIPEDMKEVPGSDFWVDGSAGKGKKGPGREFETDNAESAKVTFNFPQTVKKLEDGQEANTSRIYTVEMTADKLLLIVEKLLEMKAMELEKDVSTIIKETTSKKTEVTGDGASSSDNGVMYQ